MRHAKIIFTLFGFVFAIQSMAQAKEWRGIAPLHSNRADVERLFGAGTAACKCIYELKDVILQVSYSDDGCDSDGGGWNVPRGTLLRFNVHPKMKLLLADLALDLRLNLRSFTKTEDSELPGIFHYTNKHEGLVISANRNRVIDYGFEPSARDKLLRCPAKSVRQKLHPTILSGRATLTMSGVTWRGPLTNTGRQTVTTATSPSQEYVATLYIVSGGGAGGYVYKVVNLRKKGERFDPKKGVIFTETRTRDVTLSWEAHDHLMVKHSKVGNIYTQAKEWGSDKRIRISYVGSD